MYGRSDGSPDLQWRYYDEPLMHNPQDTLIFNAPPAISVWVEKLFADSLDSSIQRDHVPFDMDGHAYPFIAAPHMIHMPDAVNTRDIVFNHDDGILVNCIALCAFTDFYRVD